MNYDVKKFGTLQTGKKPRKSHRKYPFEMQIEKHLKILCEITVQKGLYPWPKYLQIPPENFSFQEEIPWKMSVVLSLSWWYNPTKISRAKEVNTEKFVRKMNIPRLLRRMCESTRKESFQSRIVNVKAEYWPFWKASDAFRVELSERKAGLCSIWCVCELLYYFCMCMSVDARGRQRLLLNQKSRDTQTKQSNK